LSVRSADQEAGPQEAEGRKKGDGRLDFFRKRGPSYDNGKMLGQLRAFRDGTEREREEALTDFVWVECGAITEWQAGHLSWIARRLGREDLELEFRIAITRWVRGNWDLAWISEDPKQAAPESEDWHPQPVGSYPPQPREAGDWQRRDLGPCPYYKEAYPDVDANERRDKRGPDGSAPNIDGSSLDVGGVVYLLCCERGDRFRTVLNRGGWGKKIEDESGNLVSPGPRQDALGNRRHEHQTPKDRHNTEICRKAYFEDGFFILNDEAGAEEWRRRETLNALAQSICHLKELDADGHRTKTPRRKSIERRLVVAQYLCDGYDQSEIRRLVLKDDGGQYNIKTIELDVRHIKDCLREVMWDGDEPSVWKLRGRNWKLKRSRSLCRQQIHSAGNVRLEAACHLRAEQAASWL
jgi:hypothetical protein